VTEATLTNDVAALATRHGLLWHHCPDARRCAGPRGLPDLLIAGPGGLLLAELKSETGDTSAAQDAWAWTLTRARQQYELWRPEHWRDGTIEKVLSGLV